MELQEKKYEVDNFRNILKLLRLKNAPKIKQVSSTHYYGQHDGNGVEKFVEYSDRVEIHILKEVDGRFELTEHSPIKDRNEGFEWLKKRGFTKANIVTMDYSEYEYKDGVIGLYIIDDFLRSVILNYPEGKHEKIEKEFGLQNAKRLTVPYNKQLNEIGRLRTKKLA